MVSRAEPHTHHPAGRTSPGARGALLGKHPGGSTTGRSRRGVFFTLVIPEQNLCCPIPTQSCSSCGGICVSSGAEAADTSLGWALPCL